GEIRAAVADARVLMLSGFSDRERVRAALRAGALGKMLKNGGGPDIIQAVRRVASGQTALGAGLAEVVAEALRGEPEEERVRRLVATLSERELEGLRLAA